MPVVNAFPSGTRREVERSVASGRRVIEPWTVLVDAVDNVQEAINAPQLPADSTPLISDPTMFVSRKRARAISPYLWEIDVEYEAPTGSTGQPNPTLNDPVLSWSTVEVQERIDVDLDGRPVANTANMPFDGGIEITVTDQVLHIQRYLKESDFDAKRQRDFKRATNSDKFMHADIGQAKIVALDGVLYKVGTNTYWDVSGTVQFKDPADYIGVDPSKLWYSRKVNEGFEEFGLFGPPLPPPLPPASTLGWRKILDSNNDPIARPALLKYAGDPNQPPFTGATLRHLTPSAGDPIQVLYFRTFKPMQFGNFKLFDGLS